MGLTFRCCSATEYISGTTQNPLITASDVAFRSDLRIFGSDGNVTMNKYVVLFRPLRVADLFFF